MSSALDSYISETVTVFEGLVKDTPEYYQTARGDQFVLIRVRGQAKPLAIPVNRKYEIPTMGDHISVEANEGKEWFFCSHRAVVVIKKPDWATWKKPSTINESLREQAEGIVMGYLKEHGEVSSDDVSVPIQNLFPERDARIVGVIFLGLSKRGVIHKFGYKHSERRQLHGSDTPMWHMTVTKK